MSEMWILQHSQSKPGEDRGTRRWAGVGRLALCIVERYSPLVQRSSMSPRLTTIVPGTEGTSCHASLYLHTYSAQTHVLDSHSYWR